MKPAERRAHQLADDKRHHQKCAQKCRQRQRKEGNPKRRARPRQFGQQKENHGIDAEYEQREAADAAPKQRPSQLQGLFVCRFMGLHRDIHLRRSSGKIMAVEWD